jgi:hypothetical protein
MKRFYQQLSVIPAKAHGRMPKFKGIQEVGFSRCGIKSGMTENFGLQVQKFQLLNKLLFMYNPRAKRLTQRRRLYGHIFIEHGAAVIHVPFPDSR